MSLVRGLVADFRSMEEAALAIAALRARGWTALDAYAPYPALALEEALGLRRSRLPWLVFACGVLGATGAYGLQWYLSARVYPLEVGGFPPSSTWAFFPITFEMTVLAASFACFFGLLARIGLPRHHHPLFEVEALDSAYVDRFWVGISAEDPRWEEGAARADLAATGAAQVLAVGGAP